MSAFPPTVKGALKAALFARLNPLRELPGGAALRAIHTAAFSGAEDLFDFIELAKPTLPAGFLSIPRADYSGMTPPANPPRRINYVLNYEFAVVFASRLDQEGKEDALFRVSDAVEAALFDPLIPASETPSGWAFDPPTLRGMTPVENPDCIAGIFAFDVRARGLC